MTRSSLLLHEMPAEGLGESRRFAWVLVAVGALLALSAPWIRKSGGGARSAAR